MTTTGEPAHETLTIRMMLSQLFELTPYQEQGVDLISEIPPGQWVSWGNIGDQVGTTGLVMARQMLALPRLDRRTGGKYDPAKSLLPWWRVRNSKGVLHAPGHWNGEIAAVEDIRNRYYEAEGGHLVNGRAIDADRYHF